MGRGRGPWHGASPARGRGHPGGGPACQRPYIKWPRSANPNPPPAILGLSLSPTAALVPTLIPHLASLRRRRSVPPAVDSSVLVGGSAVLVTCVLTHRRIWSPVPGPWCLRRIFLTGLSEKISTGLARGPSGPCPTKWPMDRAMGRGRGPGTVRCGPWPNAACSVPARSGPSGPRAAPGRPVVHL
jgi:hypothetical protein